MSVKRMQRKLWGGTVYFRFYSDGRIRVRADHPSNDPATEMMMAAAAVAVVTDAHDGLGLRTEVGPLTWHDDPPTVAA